MESFIRNEGEISGVLCINVIFSWAIRKSALLTSLTIKKNKNVLKSGCFEKPLRRKAPNFVSKLWGNVKSPVYRPSRAGRAEGASAPSPIKFSESVPFFSKSSLNMPFWKYLIWNSKYSVVLKMPWGSNWQLTDCKV